ncbi:MAG TPA: hypothetical protein VFN37_07685 [Candidatus Baltobacteraceae bacterium]|nr:hypothetical protein [Candidatus Baltobacteraceae bacterium]
MICVILAAAAALPAQWNFWQWYSAVAPSRAVMQQVTLPPAVLGKAQAGLQDVRVIDERGDQVPYALVIHRGSNDVKWTDSRIDDYGYVQRRYTQFVATAPVPDRDYTSIELSTPAANFATSVDVMASDDRMNWRIVRSGAPIFDYQRDGLGSNTRISIAPSHARYYKVYVHDATAAFPIDGARFAQGAKVPPELLRYSRLRTTVSQRGGDTILLADTGYAHVPASLLRLDTSTQRFSREAVAEVSEDGSNWSQVARFTLERTIKREIRSVSFDESQGRYWRVTIANGNNTPHSGGHRRIPDTHRPLDPGRSRTSGCSGRRLVLPSLPWVG